MLHSGRTQHAAFQRCCTFRLLMNKTSLCGKECLQTGETLTGRSSVVCWKEKSQAASRKSVCTECMLVYPEQSFLLAGDTFKLPLNCNVKLIHRCVASCNLLHIDLIVFPHVFQEIRLNSCLSYRG